MRIRALAIVVLLSLFLVIATQNTEVISFRLLFWTFVMSRIVLLAICLGTGVIVGFLIGRPWRKREQYARLDRSRRSRV